MRAQHLALVMATTALATHTFAGPTAFGKQLLSVLGKDSKVVLSQYGMKEIQLLKDYDYLEGFGATSAVSYYGKGAMPDDYLAGLTFARSMTCFFDQSGCFIGLYGPGDGSIQGTLGTIEKELGLSKGTLKLGKAVLTGKSLVREVNGGPVHIYATSWGTKAKKGIGAIWLSKTSRPGKCMASSF